MPQPSKRMIVIVSENIFQGSFKTDGSRQVRAMQMITLFQISQTRFHNQIMRKESLKHAGPYGLYPKRRQASFSRGMKHKWSSKTTLMRICSEVSSILQLKEKIKGICLLHKVIVATAASGYQNLFVRRLMKIGYGFQLVKNLTSEPVLASLTS